MVVRALLWLGGSAVLVWIIVALVGLARRGGKGMRAAGATLMLFGWGFMRDPRNDTVAEAQDGRIRGSNESGDPHR